MASVTNKPGFFPADFESTITTRSKSKLKNEPFLQEESQEDVESSDDEGNLQFLWKQIEYVRKHPPQGGSVGKKWSILVNDMDVEIEDRFIGNSKLQRLLTNQSAGKVREYINNYCLQKYQNTHGSE
jgi:hypothetical protein